MLKTIENLVKGSFSLSDQEGAEGVTLIVFLVTFLYSGSAKTSNLRSIREFNTLPTLEFYLGGSRAVFVRLEFFSSKPEVILWQELFTHVAHEKLPQIPFGGGY